MQQCVIRDAITVSILVLVLVLVLVLLLAMRVAQTVRGGAQTVMRGGTQLFDPMRASKEFRREILSAIRHQRSRRVLETVISAHPPVCDAAILARLRAVAAPPRAAPASRRHARAAALDKWPLIAERMRGASASASASAAAPRTCLDIGCADGSITAAVADKLGLPPDRALACDIVDRVAPDARARIQFAQSTATRLPFADASVDLVTMNMVAHHFSDPAAMFREARRVSRAGALLLLREHDPPPGQLAATTKRLNIEHALWACIYNQEQTPEEFLADYRAPGGYAHYRPLAAFVGELAAAGFRLVDRDWPCENDSNYAAYALFEAVDN